MIPREMRQLFHTPPEQLCPSGWHPKGMGCGCQPKAEKEGRTANPAEWDVVRTEAEDPRESLWDKRAT